MPKIHIPPPYRGPTQGAEFVDVEGATVRECIEAVDAKFPGFLPLVVDANGEMRKFATMFRNGDKLMGDVLAAELEPGDEIEIISSVAGG